MRALHHLRALAFSVAIAIVIVVAGCGAPHGQPSTDSEVLAPNQITDFATLYSENCSACHGADGKGGAAIALANPVYLAIADDATIRKVAAQGIAGTAMPAFAQSAGGMLTDAQLDIITQGIRSRWSKPGALNGASAPGYSAKSTGDAQRGETAYKTFCESCHGPGGRGAPKGKRHHRRIFPRTHQRSESSHHRDRRSPRNRNARLAQQRRRQTDVRSGSHRRRRLARLKARAKSRPAISRCPCFPTTLSPRSLTVPNENNLSRRGLFMKLGILFNGVAPLSSPSPSCVSFFPRSRVAAQTHISSWVSLGSVSEFPEGETRLATFRNPYVMPTDGKTVDTACWVRRVGGE